MKSICKLYKRIWTLQILLCDYMRGKVIDQARKQDRNYLMEGAMLNPHRGPISVSCSLAEKEKISVAKAEKTKWRVGLSKNFQSHNWPSQYGLCGLCRILAKLLVISLKYMLCSLFWIIPTVLMRRYYVPTEQSTYHVTWKLW